MLAHLKQKHNMSIFFKRTGRMTSFSSWICERKNSYMAFCSVCNCELTGSVILMERHSKTEKHMKNLEFRHKSANYCIGNKFRYVLLLQSITCLLLLQITCQGLWLMNFLTQKLQIAVKCAWRKVTSPFKQDIGPSYFDDSIFHLKRIMFSLIIDESTDLSTSNHPALIDSFSDLDIQRAQDKILCLMGSRRMHS